MKLGGAVTPNVYLGECTADFKAENLGLDPENFNLPGISLPHGNAMMAPYAFAIDKVIKKIPLIGTVKADPESVQEKYGLIGEPIFIGIVIGLLIGFFGNRRKSLGSLISTLVLDIPHSLK